MRSIREFCARTQPWKAGRFVPLGTADIDLARPPGALDLPDDAPMIHALVRVGAVPIGETIVDRSALRRPETLLAELRRTHAAAVARELAGRSLRQGPPGRLPELEALLSDALPDERGPLVTVAVCTRDRAQGLRETLAALTRQRHPRLDLLVIDNAPSTDDTARVVAEHPGVRRVIEPRSGLDRARNRALAEARGSILAFTDDDVRPDPEWIGALVQAFAETPEASAVTGLVAPASLAHCAQLLFESYGGFGRGFERAWHAPDVARSETPFALKNTGRFGTGANMAFRTNALRALGGFDPALDVGTQALGGGDLDAFFRVIKSGRTVLYDPRAVVRHRHRESYDALLAQLEQWGSGMAAFTAAAKRRYPEEQAAFSRFTTYMLFTWFFRRLLLSFARKAFPRELILAELRGRRAGASRYELARRALDADELAMPSVPARSSPRPLAPERAYELDLGRPIETLEGSDEVRQVRVRVTRDGRELTRLVIVNGGQCVSATRLRDALARTIPDRLLGRGVPELVASLPGRAVPPATRDRASVARP